MSVTTYIAFVDMLGTKYRAQNDHNQYYQSVRQFQEVVANSCEILGGDGEGTSGAVYVFSECAYIQSSSLKKLVDYVREVRGALMDSGFYLKGAISKGNLEATDAYLSGEVTNQVTSRRMEIVKGHSFGRDVAALFSDQEKLKGVGVRISDELREVVLGRKWAVESCHLPAASSRKCETFLDIRYRSDELGRDMLENSMRDLFRASTQSKDYARYYVSLLVSWIRSSDFSAMDLDQSGFDTRQGLTPAIYDVVMRSMFGRQLSDLVGIEYVYLSLLDKIYNDCGDGRVSRYVASYIASRKRIVNSLERLPRGVLDPGNRRTFETFLAKSFVRPAGKFAGARKSED